ncbi:unnamed protein product, partial [Didymodactylos carnosus]
MEMVFDNSLPESTILLKVIEATNFGAFSRTEKMLAENNIVYDEDGLSTISDEAEVIKILFHVIILRYSQKYRRALEILESMNNVFDDHSNGPQRLLFLLEKGFCLKLIRLETKSYLIDHNNMRNNDKIREEPFLIINLLEEAMNVARTKLSTSDNSAREIVFDIQTLIIEEYMELKQNASVDEQLRQVTYVGNPIFKTYFWLQIAKHKLEENNVDDFHSSLDVASYAVLNNDNVLLICEYYLLGAKACFDELNCKDFLICREKIDKLLSKTLFKNDYSSSTAAVSLYSTIISSWYDQYEALCIAFADKLLKPLQIRNTTFERCPDPKWSRMMRREAFRTADWRNMRGYITEEMVLANLFHLESKTVKIPKTDAYLTYKINGLYDEGKIDCLVFSSDFYDLVPTDKILNSENLLKQLSPVLKDVGEEHKFEQNISQIKAEYPDIYADFLLPVENILNAHSIANIKIVSEVDFHRKILGKAAKQMTKNDLAIPSGHCYIQYSSCTLRANDTIYCYVIFGRQNIEFEAIDLKKYDLTVDDFLEDISFMAEGFDEVPEQESASEQNTESQEEENKVTIAEERLKTLRRKFFKILFEPIMVHLETVTCLKIIAEEQLQYIPFSSLLISDDDEMYLIDKFEISFVLSVGVDQIFQLNVPSSQSSVSCKLEIFNTEKIHPELEEKYDLGYSLTDIIDRLKNENARFESHPRATKKEVDIFFDCRKHSQPTIFHYAGHTFFNEQEMQDPYALSGCMILQHENGKKYVDSMLYSNQIAKYDLRNIKLAVLNSCSTFK